MSRMTAYHPQGNGVVERENEDMGNDIRSLLLKRDETDWDLILPHTMRSIRAMPHGITAEAPNFLMFERELELPDTLLAGQTKEGNTREQYALDHKTNGKHVN